MMAITDEKTLIREIKKARKVFVWVDIWEDSLGAKEGEYVQVAKNRIIEVIEDGQPGDEGFKIRAEEAGPVIYIGV